MGATGVWVVGAVPDGETAVLSRRFRELVGEAEFSRPPRHAETLAWWRRGCDGEPFFTRTETAVLPTDAGIRFAEFLHGATVETDSTDELWDAALALMEGGDSAGLCGLAARKASPVAALHYALGAEAVAHLPGRFGEFVLTVEGVRAALPGAERTLRLDGERRAEVADRIHEWMVGMGDEPGLAPGDLLDGPLRVLHHAADAGLGVVAFTRWY